MYPPGDAPKRDITSSEEVISCDSGKSGRESNGLGADNVYRLKRPKILLIGASPLLMGCLVPALSRRLHFDIVASPETNGEQSPQDSVPCDLVIIFSQGKESRGNFAAVKELLDQSAQPPPFVVLADSEDAEDILAAFEQGARAYIPTSVTLEVMIEAIKLVVAGGTYIPSCVLSICANCIEAKHPAYALTPREISVLEAVRQGLPNKIIAQELGISESTIKVHVHRLLKKLKVQNRTQAAICASLIAAQ